MDHRRRDELRRTVEVALRSICTRCQRKLPDAVARGKAAMRSVGGRWRLGLLGLVAAATIVIIMSLPREQQIAEAVEIAELPSALPVASVPGALPPRVNMSRAKVEARLDRLDQATAQVAEKHLRRISDFLNEKKQGAGAFAEEAYSLTGKFHLVKGKLLGDDGTEFRDWLQGKFEEKVFKGEELQALVESVIDGYATEMRGLENEALVQLRADLEQDDLFEGKLPEVRTDKAFQDEYRRLARELVPSVITDLKIGAAGFVTNFILSEVATRAIGPGLAEHLGLTGAGVWNGFARSGVNIGVGLVAWWALDMIIDWLLDLFGYGPAADLAATVEQMLGRMESRLIDGDPLHGAPLNSPALPLLPVGPMQAPPITLEPLPLVPEWPLGIEPVVPPLPEWRLGIPPVPDLPPNGPFDIAPLPLLWPVDPLLGTPGGTQQPPGILLDFPITPPPLPGLAPGDGMLGLGQDRLPGLRREFQRFHEVQSRLRRAALLKLVDRCN